MKHFFPPLTWVPAYRKADLPGDLTAGVTVGVMLIPQGMAYALIAGLPPIYGLYAAFVPLLIYALFGTSRQLAVGPVAMVSLLVAAGVGALQPQGVEEYVTLAIILSLLVGLIQFVLGLVRFGFLVNFLSHPVLSGFTSAAALIIGLSQLKHLMGVDLARSKYVHEILIEAAQHLGAIHGITLALGLSSIALMLWLRRVNRLIPGPLVVVALNTVLVWAFGWHERGVRIVGEVPSGLPSFGLPELEQSTIFALMPAAVTIALVSFMESIAVAKAFATKNRYSVDANQELVALGLANVFGAMFQAYPTTGGFSRTAVNGQAGATSTLASLISAGVIALTLLFLTPLFYYMPNVVLAAIVMTAVAGLVDLKEVRYLWRVKRRDLALLALTFFATLGLGIEEGILVGVIASLVLVIYQSSDPHVARLGQLPGTTTYRNVDRHAECITHPNVAVLRIDADLYFANTSVFKDEVCNLAEQQQGLHAIVLDAYPINTIDSSAMHTLKEVVDDCSARGVTLYFAGVKGPVMDQLQRAKLDTLLGPERFFMETHAAVEAARGQAQTPSTSPTKQSARFPAPA